MLPLLPLLLPLQLHVACVFLWLPQAANSSSHLGEAKQLCRHVWSWAWGLWGLSLSLPLSLSSGVAFDIDDVFVSFTAQKLCKMQSQQGAETEKETSTNRDCKRKMFLPAMEGYIRFIHVYVSMVYFDFQHSQILKWFCFGMTFHLCFSCQIDRAILKIWWISYNNYLQSIP